MGTNTFIVTHKGGAEAARNEATSKSAVIAELNDLQSGGFKGNVVHGLDGSISYSLSNGVRGVGGYFAPEE